MKNWKTSFFGAIPGLSMFIEALQRKDYPSAIGGLALCLAFLFARDKDK